MHSVVLVASGWAAEQLTAMADTFQVQLEFEGQTHTFPCGSDQTVLSAAEAANVALPSSCCAGVCTTCAASIRSGDLHQPDAMGVKEELRQKGFALLCVAQPRSDVQLLGGQEDALYEAQFGQYQK
jgi:ferredoxin